MGRTLTVATAVYRGFDETWFTLEALRTYHGDDFELLVVDNAPESCRQTKAVAAATRAQYVHRPDLHGTSAPRDACFRLAKTPWVLVLDNHVLLEKNAVAAAIRYADENPDSRDIISGPLVWDNGIGASSHWNPYAPGGLWGEWSNPQKLGLPPNRLDDPTPFEIPQMGLGMWMMRRDVWPGFNPRFRGFGGEEGYIHEKTRRLGGKAICLPALRWRHKFRDTGGSSKPPPYHLSTADHTWNLLVGHRELGVNRTEDIWEHFGKRVWSRDKFDAQVMAAEQAQPDNQLSLPSRKRVLGVWYSNNSAPPKLLSSSLKTIQAAVRTSIHDVTVVTCPWKPISQNPFTQVLATEQLGNHLGIVRQIRQCLTTAGPGPWDAVVFLEHDVLYNPGHFDRMMKAFELKPEASVASCLDYEGLNETGWLGVTNRHEPFHQLAMRYDAAVASLTRAEADCVKQGWAYLEPDSDLVSGRPVGRESWARIAPEGFGPNIHVNHTSGRFTSHGEVVYQASSADAKGRPRTTHAYWGKHVDWWPYPAPTKAEPVITATSPNATEAKTDGCGCKAKVVPPASIVSAKTPTLAAWFETVAATPSDVNEHLPLIRELAAKCTHLTETSVWPKPVFVALAAGLPETGTLVSVAEKPKTWWPRMSRFLGQRFVTRQGIPLETEIDETDMLFVDSEHTGKRVYDEFVKHHGRVRKYMVVHASDTFGAKGDDNKSVGVRTGVVRFLREHSDWVMKVILENNHGLIVLSRDPADKEPVQHGVKDYLRFAKAVVKRALNGGTYLPLPMAQERIDTCLACPHRGGETGTNCRVCKCFLFQMPDKAGNGPGKTFWPADECPLGKWSARPTDGVKMTGDEVKILLEQAFNGDSLADPVASTDQT